METKPFNYKLYKENDTRGKMAVKKFLESTGEVSVKVNPNTYEIDLIAIDKTGMEFYIECEVKLGWKGELFPFDDVRIPYRKVKYAFPGALFFVLNEECTFALWTVSSNVVSSPVGIVPTKYTSNEKFFKVPLEKMTMIEIK